MTKKLSSPLVWHPLDKHRPKERGWYLVAVKATRATQAAVTLGWFDDGAFIEVWNFDNDCKMGKITHWMPRPELPR